uniref:Growth factor receptor domain-containing protein n=1 Tax=Oryzias melastigma TaxID=30732 RepID=A0A3B3B5X1_ORYME
EAQECEPCHRSCHTCGGPQYDDCDTSCAHYFFLHEGECVDDCPAGYFSSENECVGCHVDCASCDGPSFDDCSVCRNPKAVLHHGECLPKCPDRFYYDKTTNECKDCDKSCLTCSGHEPSDCLSCSAKKHKDASGHCVWDSQCSPGSYLDQNGECRQCHALCQNCSGPNRDHCLSCKPPHLLLSDTCVKSCPLGYYAEKNSELSCGLCHFGCESCVGRHSQQCVTCKTGFFKHARSCEMNQLIYLKCEFLKANVTC